MKAWDGVSATYRASFATLCAGTISAILEDLSPGRLLDVGCGTGELLVEAERRGFRCDGVDSDTDMVTSAGRAVAGRVCQAVLPDLPFADETFEAVVANFVVNHVADPRAAVRELARVLSPGGQLAVTIWPSGSTAWGSLVNEVFSDAGVVPIASNRLPAHLDFARSVDGLTDVMGHAGMTVVKATEVEWTWRISPENLWAGIEGGIANPGQTYTAQTASIRSAATKLFYSRAAAQVIDSQFQLHFPSRAAYVLASR